MATVKAFDLEDPVIGAFVFQAVVVAMKVQIKFCLYYWTRSCCVCRRKDKEQFQLCLYNLLSLNPAGGGWSPCAIFRASRSAGRMIGMLQTLRYTAEHPEIKNDA